jgi:5'-3' exonuclease
MGGGCRIAWKLIQAHLHRTSVTALVREKITTLFIDASVLMHKAIMRVPQDAKPGADKTSFIQVCLEDLHTWRSWGLKPVLVFDGEAPASKVDTNAKREENRNKFRQKYADSVTKGCVDPTFLAMAFDVHGEARLLLIAAL